MKCIDTTPESLNLLPLILEIYALPQHQCRIKTKSRLTIPQLWLKDSHKESGILLADGNHLRMVNHILFISFVFNWLWILPGFFNINK